MGLTCKGFGKFRGMMDKLISADEKRKEQVKNAKSKSSKKETN